MPRVNENDTVYFSSPNGYAVAKANVQRVQQFNDLDPGRVKCIIEEVREQMADAPDVEMDPRELYAEALSLIWYENVQEIPPTLIDRQVTFRSGGWVSIKDFRRVITRSE